MDKYKKFTKDIPKQESPDNLKENTNGFISKEKEKNTTIFILENGVKKQLLREQI